MHHTSINTTLYFKMLYVALSGLVLICSFFEETYFCHLHTYLLACFLHEIHLKFPLSHIYFHLGNSELWKQYQSVSQEIMGQICNIWLYIYIHEQFSLFDTNTSVLTGFMISLFLTAPAARVKRAWDLKRTSVRNGLRFFLLFGRKYFFIQKSSFLIIN